MNPLDFLTITSKKLKNQSSEADLRTSVGRSYYAVYHMIRNAIEAENIQLTLKHGALWNSFFQTGVPPDAKAIAKNMQTLYKARHEADYQLRNALTKQQTTTAYNLACKVNSEFVKVFDGTTKKRILDGVRASQRLKGS